MNLQKSLSIQRQEHKPSSTAPDFILDFQMELLNTSDPNIEIECGPKRHLFGDDNDEIEWIKNNIHHIWNKHKSLISKIKFWKHTLLSSLLICFLLIILNIITYILFIEYDIDTQSNNSCSLFNLFYEISAIIVLGIPLIYLRIRNYYRSLTYKWRTHFINNIIILVDKLSIKYKNQNYIFQCIYPIKVNPLNKPLQCWCYLRIQSNANDDQTYSTQNNTTQPIFATSKMYSGETHLIMDIDLFLKDDRLGINIINGKKRDQFEDSIEDIGSFILDMKIGCKTCILRISWLLLIVICFVILSIPWVVCSDIAVGNDTLLSEIIIIFGVSIPLIISFVLVTFCSRRCLYHYRKKKFIKILTDYMNNILATKYPDFAYSIIYSKDKNAKDMWCQFRISDHVLKCRSDDIVNFTTYNAKTSISIRNKSICDPKLKPKAQLVK